MKQENGISQNMVGGRELNTVESELEIVSVEEYLLKLNCKKKQKGLRKNWTEKKSDWNICCMSRPSSFRGTWYPSWSAFVKTSR